MMKKINNSAKPYLKWAGGEQQLLSQYDKYFPRNPKRYFEPSVGCKADEE